MKRIFSLLLLISFAFQATIAMEEKKHEQQTIDDLPAAVYAALEADKEYSSLGEIPKDKDKLCAWMEEHLWNELPRKLTPTTYITPTSKISVHKCKKHLTYIPGSKTTSLIHKTNEHNKIIATYDDSKKENSLLTVMEGVHARSAVSTKDCQMVAYKNGTIYIQTEIEHWRGNKKFTHILHPSAFRRFEVTSDSNDKESTTILEMREKFKPYSELDEEVETIFDRDGSGAIVQIKDGEKPTFLLFANNELIAKNMLLQCDNDSLEYKVHTTLHPNEEDSSNPTIIIYVSRINTDAPENSPPTYTYNLDTGEFKQADTLLAHPPVYYDNDWIIDAQTGYTFSYEDQKPVLSINKQETAIELIGSKKNIHPTKKNLSTWFKLKKDGDIKIYQIEPPLDKTKPWKPSDQLWLTALYYLHSKNKNTEGLLQLWRTIQTEEDHERKYKGSELIDEAVITRLAQLRAAEIPKLGTYALELTESTAEKTAFTSLDEKELFNKKVAEAIATKCKTEIATYLNSKIQKERAELARKKQEKEEKERKEQERKATKREKRRADKIALRKANADSDIYIDADIDVSYSSYDDSDDSDPSNKQMQKPKCGFGSKNKYDKPSISANSKSRQNQSFAPRKIKALKPDSDVDASTISSDSDEDSSDDDSDS